MSIKTPATISAFLTILILLVLALVSLLVQTAALNGAGERQGITAMSLSLACQGAAMLLAGISARWLTDFLITKAEWNHIMAIASVVLMVASVAGAISFLSMILSIPVAGIR